MPTSAKVSPMIAIRLLLATMRCMRSPCSAAHASSARVSPEPSVIVMTGCRDSSLALSTLPDRMRPGAAIHAKSTSPTTCDATFGSSGGPGTIAKSSSPRTTWRSSRRPRSTWGCSTSCGCSVRTRATRRGSQVRAPSSLMPKRQVPASVGGPFNAPRIPSFSSSICAAMGNRRWPASVSCARLLERSNSSASTDASSSAMRLDNDDWVTCTRCAASAKLPRVAAR